MSDQAVVAAASIPSPRPPSVAEIVQAGEQLHALLEDAVLRVRLNGGSWAAVGGALGVSRQAARKRFGHLDGEAGGRVLLVVEPGRVGFVSERLGEPLAADPVERLQAARLASRRLREVGR